jgi:hypothetical protein
LSTGDNGNVHTGGASCTLCTLANFVSNHLGPCSLPPRSYPKSAAHEILHVQVRSSTIKTSKNPEVNDRNGH